MKHITLAVLLTLGGAPTSVISADKATPDVEVNDLNTAVTATKNLAERGGTAAGTTEAASSASGTATTTAVAVGAAVAVTAAVVLGSSGGSSGVDGTN
ncbi:hypothetical protein NP165_12290 [Vibrio japonicus]|uniref:Secreted protein n=2 Tax=Vibrio japonicus TaxID=1824638 RepID=A0ABY5LJ71_9VIBR|nr:hypothetical protein NP165_12290 [Vibrio japonicus]